MESSHLNIRQIIATSEKDILLSKDKNIDTTAFIISSEAEIESIKRIYDFALCGMYLDCSNIKVSCNCFETEKYISDCKKSFKNRISNRPAFFYITGAKTFKLLRAAVLAVTDISGKTILTQIHVVDDGKMIDNTDVIAAVGVLQRIGVSTVIFTSDTPTQLEEALERVAPYTRISIGVCIPAKWLDMGIKLTNVEILLPFYDEDINVLYKSLEKYKSGVFVARDYGDYILAPDGREAHFIDAVTSISDEIDCNHKLEERLLEIEDEQAGALKIVIHEEDDLYNLEAYLYMLTRPVCLCAQTPELLEKALRIYDGLAIYDGTWELETDIIKYFSEKYGMIWL